MIINNTEFKTQKEALDYFKNILNQCNINEIIPQHFDDLYELLCRHPHAIEKIGCGVESFMIKPDGYGHKCFWLIRVDGTIEDFSYIISVKGKDITNELKFRKACRTAIRHQIVEYRDKYFDGKLYAKCEKTGKEIELSTCHVDHIEPMYFERIVSMFINEYSIDVDKITYDTTGTTCRLMDSELLRNWVEYHIKYAKLRCVDKQYNLKTAYLAKENTVDESWMNDDIFIFTYKGKDYECSGYTEILALKNMAEKCGGSHSYTITYDNSHNETKKLHIFDKNGNEIKDYKIKLKINRK